MMDRKWLHCAQSSQMQFAVRASSQQRAWTGFDATLCDATAGIAEVSHSPSHNITMQVGAPVIASCRCDGEIQRRLQSPGDMDLVPAGFHAIWEDREPTTLLILNISPRIVRSTAEAMRINPDTVQLTPRLQLRDPRLQHVAWALKAELETGEPSDRLYAETLATALVVQLLRQYTSAGVAAPKRGLTSRQLEHVVSYVEGHLGSNLSLFELSAVAGVSASHFKTLFKQSTGLPVHQYVVRRRVEHAVSLISKKSIRLSEVAVQAGFADQSHMARCFRRVLGVTPAVIAHESH